MKVLRYTSDVQKQIKSNIGAEPWLHIGILDDGRYAIWPWDTREIIRRGKCDPTKVTGTPAKDNHKPLSGPHAEDFVVKMLMANRWRHLIQHDTSC